ncbi:hypothetical protein JHK82_027268 [Glycine max]|uniref:Uncharacterized protein n=1 Tax=Glycine soja TaxID=3848 RepID=A0A0B2RPT9_GLYSO|nr:hypothetical protein JHK82_027268 [Glycine max]KHN34284.1 hypothetical protein glysoja_046322 [Glycine soja]
MGCEYTHIYQYNNISNQRNKEMSKRCVVKENKATKNANSTRILLRKRKIMTPCGRFITLSSHLLSKLKQEILLPS